MTLFTRLLRKLHLVHTPKIDYLGLMAKEHWQEYCPRMYKELEESGQLEEMLYQAQELTASTLKELKAQGMSHDMAWEFVREQWILLPEEKDD